MKKKILSYVLIALVTVLVLFFSLKDHFSEIIETLIMSQKSKVNRERRAAQQEKKGKKVVNWIFGVLIVLSIFSMIYTTILAS